MTKRVMNFGVLLSLAMFAAACAPPKVLFKENTSGGKLIQQYATQASSGEKGFYDYNIRVCDLEDNGVTRACKDTLILPNVSLQSGGMC